MSPFCSEYTAQKTNKLVIDIFIFYSAQLSCIYFTFTSTPIVENIHMLWDMKSATSVDKSTKKKNL